MDQNQKTIGVAKTGLAPGPATRFLRGGCLGRTSQAVASSLSASRPLGVGPVTLRRTLEEE
jgi:hypothetical protein